MALAGGHGNPVYLNQASPQLLRRFPLISSPGTRQARRHRCLRLVWQGTSCQVSSAAGPRPSRSAWPTPFRDIACTRVHPAERLARRRGAQLVAALPVKVVLLRLRYARTRAWVYDGGMLTMSGAGSVSAP